MQAEIQTVQEALRTGLPLLGICLGHQVLARAAGAEVTAILLPEVGFRDGGGAPFTVSITDFGRFDPLFDGIESPFRVFQLHGEAVQPLREIEVLATGEHCEGASDSSRSPCIRITDAHRSDPRNASPGRRRPGTSHRRRRLVG